jgi:hypothetical protein
MRENLEEKLTMLGGCAACSNEHPWQHRLRSRQQGGQIEVAREEFPIGKMVRLRRHTGTVQ